MEAYFTLYLQIEKPSVEKFIKKMMTRGKRPDFDDEVPVFRRKAFSVLEFTEYADEINKIDNDYFEMVWSVLGGQVIKEINNICSGLHLAGATNMIGSFDDDEDTNEVVVWDGSRLRILQGIDENPIQLFSDKMAGSKNYADTINTIFQNIDEGQYTLGPAIY